VKTRSIGNLRVSIVGLGTNNFGTDFFGKKCDAAQASRVLNAALDAGVTLIDTAEEYSVVTSYGRGESEQFIGAALGARRNEAVIATKFSIRASDDSEERGAKRIVRAVEGSLKRLRTDRIDLYQQHFPDPDVPIDEISTALDQLVRDGKVLQIGCCNFSGDMIDQALEVSEAKKLRRFASVQSQYNIFDAPTQPGVLEAVRRHGLSLIPYFPLSSGLLTGKYRAGQAPPSGSRFDTDASVAGMLVGQISDDRVRKAARLETYARERGHTLLELAISWLASQPFIGSVIAGASSPEQIQANARAASWELSSDDFAAVAAIVA
jgi:aryl-alcohol dehydrogenase-like predicted oxidoreductase